MFLRSEECLKFLKKSWRGILALCDNGKPYAFPVAYILYRDVPHFLFLKYGRKMKIIEKNPNACYLVYIEEDRKVVSILIEGILEYVENVDVVKDVVRKFVEEIFPRDPYFKNLKNIDIDKLVNDIISRKIPGIYRLEISNISCVVEYYD